MALRPINRKVREEAPDEELIQTGEGLRGARLAPASQVANAIARLQAAEETREQGTALQRRFQGGISDEALAAAGLTRLANPSPSLVQRGTGALFGALDILDRPSQAVLRTLGGISGSTGENPLGGLFGGLTGRGDRASFQNAIGIEKGGELGGLTGGILNLGGTIATDPLTFLTFGASSGAKRAIRTISGEFGEETAERVAREGLSALRPEELAVLRTKIPQFADGKLDDIADELRGGIKAGIPGTGSRTIVPGEALRGPLRRLSVRGRNVPLIDEVRPLARRGTARPGTEAPLRAAIRNSGTARLAREATNAAGSLGTALGGGIADRVLAAGGRARSTAQSREEVVQRATILLADADVDDATQARILDSMQGAGRLNPETGNFESERLSEIFAEFAAKGDEASLNTARAIEAINDLQTETRRLRLIPSGTPAVAQPRLGGAPATPFPSVPRRVTETTPAVPGARAFPDDATEKFVDTLVQSRSRALTEAELDEAVGLLTDFNPSPSIQRDTRERLVSNLDDVARMSDEEFDSFLDNIAPRGAGTPASTTTRVIPPEKPAAAARPPATFQAPAVARFTDQKGNAALATPSLGGLDNIRVPRVLTEDGRRAVKADPLLKAQLDALPPEDLRKLNETARERFGHTKVDEFFETDPARIAQIQNVHASRALAEAEYANELATIIDPTTGNRLLYSGESAARDAPQEFVETTLSGQAVRVHPELAPIIKRMDETLFNPQVQGRFVQAFDDILGMWKGFATVPIWFGFGFHARNMQGNWYLNWLEDVKINSYKDAFDAQVVINKAIKRSTKASILDDEFLASARGGRGFIDGKPTFAQTGESLGDRQLRFGEAFETRNRETFEQALRSEAEGVLDEQTIGRILDARTQGVLNSGFFDADLRGGDLIRGIRGSGKQTRLEFIREQLADPRNSIPIKQGSVIGQHVENNARLAHYFSKLDEGLSPLQASESAKRTLFDYSELTLFEQQKLKRVVPFYTFMRKNTPRQLNNLVTEPRRFLTSRRLMEGVADTTESDHRAAPDWVLNSGQVPLPGFVGSFLAGGNAAVYGSLDLPTDAAFETIEPITQFAAWALPDAVVPDEFQASRPEFFSGIVGLPGGGVTEAVKLFLEEATETDLFTGAPLDRQGKRQIFERWTNLIPIFTKGRSLVEGILDIKRVDDPEAVDSGVTVMKALLGVNLTVVGPRRERGEMLNRLDELDRALRKARERGIDMPTITEMRAAGLIPDAG